MFESIKIKFVIDKNLAELEGYKPSNHGGVTCIMITYIFYQTADILTASQCSINTAKFLLRGTDIMKTIFSKLLRSSAFSPINKFNATRYVFNRAFSLILKGYMKLLRTVAKLWLGRVAPGKSWQQYSAPWHSTRKSQKRLLKNFYNFTSPNSWFLYILNCNHMDYYVSDAV